MYKNFVSENFALFELGDVDVCCDDGSSNLHEMVILIRYEHKTYDSALERVRDNEQSANRLIRVKRN